MKKALSTFAINSFQNAYVDAVERVLKSVYLPKFRRMWETPTRKNEWTGRWQVTQNLAFLFAVAHHFTGELQYRRLARRFLVDVDRGQHFSSLFFAKAWELVGKDLIPRERAVAGRKWVEAIWTQMDYHITGGDRNNLDRLLEYKWFNNHQICSCVYADYARKLFPEYTKNARYEEVTDRVWANWWSKREYHEQTTNYESFAQVFLAVWADLRGVTREFWATPSIHNLTARGERIVSPAGIVTTYGDSNHNAKSSTWAAFFEKAALHTGEGRYKQAAWDIFGHLSRLGLWDFGDKLDRALEWNTIYNGRQLFCNYMQCGISYIGLAALWSDPRLKYVEREKRGGITTRLPLGYKLRPVDKRRLPRRKLMPQNVILTGGSMDPRQRSYVVLKVGPHLNHDHADAGALLLFSVGDTTLLGSTGYFQKALVHQNIFFAQLGSASPYPFAVPGEAPEGDRNCRGKIVDVRLGTRCSSCRVTFERFHHMPLRLTREVTVQKTGVVELVDCVIAEEHGWVGGPIFHGQTVRRITPRAYRLRLQTLHFEGYEMQNPPGELLVEFLMPEAVIGVRTLPFTMKFNTPFHRGVPCCHYKHIWKTTYQWRRCLSARVALLKGKEVTFVTRLTPGGVEAASANDIPPCHATGGHQASSTLSLSPPH